MKKIFSAGFGAILLLTSCDKNAIQQTSQTIKNADSLFQNVSRGYKTVDSISKVIRNDSAMLSPDIKEKTEIIRKQINIKNLNVKNIDSVSAALKDLSNKVKGGSEIAKTIDSAADAVKNSDDPLAAISAVTGAINKISKKNAAKVQLPQQNTSEENSSKQIPDDPAFTEQAVTKNADITIVVDDLKSSKEKLKNVLQNYHADIVTENFTDSEGTNRENYTVKIPLKYFDEGLNQISETLGDTTEKSISTEGTDYQPNQMCDIKITLKENPNFIGKHTSSNALNASKPDNNESGFNKGLHGLEAILIALVPFWPLLLVVGMGWYLIARNTRKKEEREFLRQQQYNEEMRRKIAEQSIEKPQESKNEEVTPKPEKPTDPNDYSRFMPK